MKKNLFFLSFFLLMSCQNIMWEALTGMSKPQVESRMGKPVSIMRENNHEIWTYRQNNCTKHVFFDASGIVKYVDVNGVCQK